jgi:hypothetical protein
MSHNPSGLYNGVVPKRGTTLEETLGFIQRALDLIKAGDAYLHEAFLRFGDRPRSAMPSGLARGMGLV